MVTAYLRSLAEANAEFTRLEAQEHRIRAQITGLSAAGRLPRDEVHERALR